MLNIFFCFVCLSVCLFVWGGGGLLYWRSVSDGLILRTSVIEQALVSTGFHCIWSCPCLIGDMVSILKGCDILAIATNLSKIRGSIDVLLSIKVRLSERLSQRHLLLSGQNIRKCLNYTTFVTTGTF